MDLKPQLEVRLLDIDRKIDMEKARHESVMGKYERQRATVLAMIELETAEENPQEDMFAPTQGPKREVTAADLEREILVLLKAQNNRPHADMKEALVRRGFGNSTDPQFGRRVHGTLMSLRHRGVVEQASPSTWRLVSNAETAA
ncbi:hypothetical protein UB31_21290 [Bradyrhizobium sp. LTSP849]|uniref:hypothetical protein n=1 Tax=Bradyrhizobium sp. LTSP849 TaxID=1615890 RepID=UPI0005D1471F|nr:hypothetical protein [Bradyrhizobium sp. LTSP849]KJC44111.1 hypothetical protein UB31_21290 [Bradyrhizobium sp. LTSP849]